MRVPPRTGMVCVMSCSISNRKAVHLEKMHPWASWCSGRLLTRHCSSSTTGNVAANRALPPSGQDGEAALRAGECAALEQAVRERQAYLRQLEKWNRPTWR